ncbi:MAG TPA: L,D-transpeptidase family protein [Candidatus Omnitrophota bacterium]|nr:L,D-transpeptidase family protein [Candidatus Omnitrophota bacterium]
MQIKIRKQILPCFLMLAFILTPAFCFAVEKASMKDTTNKKSVSLSQKENFPPEDFKKDKKDFFPSGNFVADSKKSESSAIASVTVGPKENDASKKVNIKETEKRSVETKKEVSVIDTKTASQKAEPAVKAETASISAGSLPEEMEKHWAALFSKEGNEGSIIYTVKPGDNLYVLALKNHTTVDLIKKINGLTSDTIYPQMKLKIQTAPFSIYVTKTKNTLTLFTNGEAIKEYSVATGKNGSTPVGTFKITTKLMNPTWFKTGAILPPESPENALGTRWLGFDKPAYGIHGTIDPQSIGKQASEGCIRMLNEQVEELYSMVPVGTQVTIQE